MIRFVHVDTTVSTARVEGGGSAMTISGESQHELSMSSTIRSRSSVTVTMSLVVCTTSMASLGPRERKR